MFSKNDCLDVDNDDEPIDRDEALEAMQNAARSEMEKAKHVDAQNKVWQRVLGTRIKMQNVVQGALKLPYFQDADELRAGAGADLSSSLKSCLADLAELRQKLLPLHSDFQPIELDRAPGKSGSSDEWWDWLHSSNSAGVTVEEGLVEEWNKKTDAQVGRQFKALGRPILEQIRFGLRNDREKLVKRTQLNRSGIKPVGKRSRNDSGDVDQEYEEEIFDDTDFYSQLLKTFLESAASESAKSVAVTRGNRRKKVIVKSKLDRRIHNELTNFMAPLTSAVLPPMADALFGSLFGQTPATVDSAHQEDVHDDDEDDVVKVF